MIPEVSAVSTAGTHTSPDIVGWPVAGVSGPGRGNQGRRGDDAGEPQQQGDQLGDSGRLPIAFPGTHRKGAGGPSPGAGPGSEINGH